MRNKLFYSFFIFLFFSCSVVAQKSKPAFRSINQAGVAGGENSADWVFQSVNGIKFLNYFAGIGIGIDQYRYKTMPLFFDTHVYFGEDKKGFFYGDMGYHFPMKNKPGKEVLYYSTYDFTGGLYTDLGVGYEFTITKKTSFLFSLGYGYKKMENKVGLNACGIAGPCSIDYNYYKLGMGRMMLKAGLAF